MNFRVIKIESRHICSCPKSQPPLAFALLIMTRVNFMNFRVIKIESRHICSCPKGQPPLALALLIINPNPPPLPSPPPPPRKAKLLISLGSVSSKFFFPHHHQKGRKETMVSVKQKEPRHKKSYLLTWRNLIE